MIKSFRMLLAVVIFLCLCLLHVPLMTELFGSNDSTALIQDDDSSFIFQK